MRLALLTLALLVPARVQDPALVAVKVAKAPAIDGVGDDDAWSKATAVKVAVADAFQPQQGRAVVTIKACRTDDAIFFLVTWPDESENASHSPWVWDREKGEYIESDDAEDSLVLSFALAGEFTPDMLAPVEATWDVWHWMAARTNPVGRARDSRHVYALSKPAVPADVYDGHDGKKVWIGRIEDEGRPVFVEKPKPASKGEKVVPRWIAQEPDGSAADVRAKGAWKDGAWTVEFARKLDTGHKDDAPFAPGAKIPMAVAVLNHSDTDHSVSPKIVLEIGR